MNNKLFVTSIEWSTTEAELTELFSEYGTVTESVIVKDRETGRSRGFGFITFETEESASAATSADGVELNGRNLIVKIAEQRERR
ncbi:RNA-binding protein [Candidatus Gracilibacteria bacterium]|nr:RNA-binding protein [Candidatus Gracilibacteria bacterium]